MERAYAFPVSGDEDLAIDLGPVPAEILDAQVHLMPVLEHLMARSKPVEPTEPPHAWTRPTEFYTSVRARKTIDAPVKEGGVDDLYFWYKYEAVEKALNDWKSRAHDILDGATAILLAHFGAGLLDETLHTSRAFITAEAKPGQPIPLFKAGALRVSQHRLPDASLMAKFEQLATAGFPPAKVIQGAAIGRWFSLAKEERDPVKQFMWAYAGLEVAASKFASRLRPSLASRLVYNDGASEISGTAVSELVWPTTLADDKQGLFPERNIVFKFSTLSLSYFPESANEDVKHFKTLNRFRNRIHGERIDPDDAEEMARMAVRLLTRYAPRLLQDL